jgi:putative SOS response-associated peptidase YedK
MIRPDDVTSCTIITSPAAEPMRPLHDRQPIILEQAAYDDWLDPATPAKVAKELLTHNLNGELQFRRVSRAVNSVKNHGADCVEPVNPLSRIFPSDSRCGQISTKSL